MVIADTSVWVPFFNRPASPEKREMDALLDADRVVLVGMVMAELIQGCRTGGEARDVVSMLGGLRYVETRPSTWRRSGDLSFALRRRGMTLPLSDLVIAALALEHRHSVYTLDPHFEHVPGLALHRTGRSGR